MNIKEYRSKSKDPSTSPEWLAQASRTSVARYVASNPNTPLGTLVQLWDNYADEVLKNPVVATLPLLMDDPEALNLSGKVLDAQIVAQVEKLSVWRCRLFWWYVVSWGPGSQAYRSYHRSAFLRVRGCFISHNEMAAYGWNDLYYYFEGLDKGHDSSYSPSLLDLLRKTRVALKYDLLALAKELRAMTNVAFDTRVEEVQELLSKGGMV